MGEGGWPEGVAAGAAGGVAPEWAEGRKSVAEAAASAASGGVPAAGPAEGGAPEWIAAGVADGSAPEEVESREPAAEAAT